MAVGRQTIFKYKTIKGSLHKVPALLKFLLLLPLSVFFMSLSPKYLVVGIIVVCTTAFLCKFTLGEQLTDLKPAAIYAVLMYGLSVFSNFIDCSTYLHTFPEQSFLHLFIPNLDFLRITLRLVLIIQLSSLLFRTTSSGELRESLHTLENAAKSCFYKIFFTKKYFIPKTHLADHIALFLCFIPEIFENWALINMMWKARGGRQGFVKIKTLVFILISLSMEKAAVKAKALEARH